MRGSQRYSRSITCDDFEAEQGSAIQEGCISCTRPSGEHEKIGPLSSGMQPTLR